MEARFGYNETHPNHYFTGLSDFIRRRNGAFICRNDIQPTKKIDMFGIDGIVICGKRGGQSFEQVTRPDFDTGSRQQVRRKHNITIMSISFRIDENLKNCYKRTFMFVIFMASGNAYNLIWPENDSIIVLGGPLENVVLIAHKPLNYAKQF